jgi:hypothetical protein
MTQCIHVMQRMFTAADESLTNRLKGGSQPTKTFRLAGTRRPLFRDRWIVLAIDADPMLRSAAMIFDELAD